MDVPAINDDKTRAALAKLERGNKMKSNCFDKIVKSNENWWVVSTVVSEEDGPAMIMEFVSDVANMGHLFEPAVFEHIKRAISVNLIKGITLDELYEADVLDDETYEKMYDDFALLLRLSDAPESDIRDVNKLPFAPIVIMIYLDNGSKKDSILQLYKELYRHNVIANADIGFEIGKPAKNNMFYYIPISFINIIKTKKLLQ